MEAPPGVYPNTGAAASRNARYLQKEQTEATSMKEVN
jgi:hypothetical protein